MKHESDPEAVVVDLATYQNAFLDLECGTNLQAHESKVAEAFQRLYDSGAPTSTYPFLMQLSNASKLGTLSSSSILSVLEVIESFLVRRAACGHEPTGLHTVFKRLWPSNPSSVSAQLVAHATKQYKTVVWPDDADVRSAVENRGLYGSSITSYVLQELNKARGGDQPTSGLWIEHVLPTNRTRNGSKNSRPSNTGR